MNPQRRRRLIWIFALLLGVGSSVSLMLFALNKNINLYYTPSELPHVLPGYPLRIGGLVEKGSLHRQPNNLTMQFVITDYHQQVRVQYTGIVPTLFREGQGVVVEGQFQGSLFKAKQVLAKHDENYKPPGISH